MIAIRPGLSVPVYLLALRGLLRGRRTLAIGLLALLPVVAAVVFAARGHVAPELFWAREVQRLIIPTITAFVAVVVGASAIGDDREDGTILYLAATPIPRLTLVLSKLAAAWTASMALLAPVVIASGLIALRGGGAGQIAWPLAGVALACLGYCAAAGWLAMTVRRPVMVGVLYILLWEGSIATFAASADRFSLAAYGRAVAVEGVIDVNAPPTSAGVAAIVLVVVGAVAAWAAARRFTRTELP